MMCCMMLTSASSMTSSALTLPVVVAALEVSAEAAASQWTTSSLCLAMYLADMGVALEDLKASVEADKDKSHNIVEPICA